MKYDSISMFSAKVDFWKICIKIVDTIFPKKLLCGNFDSPLSQRISRRHITNFRCFSKKNQNMIIDDTDNDNDNIIIRDNSNKCMEIKLFDVAKHTFLSASIVKNNFVILSQKSYENL